MMHRACPRGSGQRGFSLLEMVLVVAIIGILAVLAMPRFTQATLKAKRAEVELNLRGIAKAEMTYFTNHGEFVVAGSNPGDSLDGSQRDWDPTVEGWDQLGWAPTGGVRCNYSARVYGSGSWFRIDAYCDLDSDNQVAIVRYYSAKPSGEQPYVNDVYPERF